MTNNRPQSGKEIKEIIKQNYQSFLLGKLNQSVLDLREFYETGFTHNTISNMTLRREFGSHLLKIEGDLEALMAVLGFSDMVDKEKDINSD